MKLWHRDCHHLVRTKTIGPKPAINRERDMKWILGVMLALGLGGCNQLDDTLVRGSEQHHGLGQQVTRVEAAVPASIHLKAGEQRGIVIRGQEDLLPYLVLTERDDTLEMKVRDGYRFELSEPIDIDITLPRVEALALLAAT